jgi:hypothetical protein
VTYARGGTRTSLPLIQNGQVGSGNGGDPAVIPAPQANSGLGGSGGSGIVIISYPS